MPYLHSESVIRIAIADDHFSYLDILSAHINTIDNCKVIIRAGNGKELLEKIKRQPEVDLVITDIRMPEMNGYEAAKRIRQDFPHIRILFSSMYSNELVFRLLFETGADGFVHKNALLSEYRKAIYEVLKSGNYFAGIPVSFHRKCLNGNGKELNGRLLISDEEIELLKLACIDLTYTAIACKLKTNERHVDYIRQGLFEKFGIKTRVGLALLAYEAGLINC